MCKLFDFLLAHEYFQLQTEINQVTHCITLSNEVIQLPQNYLFGVGFIAIVLQSCAWETNIASNISSRTMSYTYIMSEIFHRTRYFDKKWKPTAYSYLKDLIVIHNSILRKNVINKHMISCKFLSTIQIFLRSNDPNPISRKIY